MSQIVTDCHKTAAVFFYDTASSPVISRSLFKFWKSCMPIFIRLQKMALSYLTRNVV